MELIADILLIAGALSAGFYCFILGRRLKRFNSLEQGVGGAVAVLSSQVDDLTKTMTAAQVTASQSAQTLTELATRAEAISRQLELQMASLHDVTDTTETPQPSANGTPTDLPQADTAPLQPSEPMFVRHTTLGDRA
ncbi:hypothetical protein [Pseudosulfitobacter sp. DSM 107133]|uniref:hypothetical protein n=1 Tax=Pseudosulfitobacter sp. DSM 107133 TaxID=2883100 RepID=UPI000DF23B82|nr:hypothetical protein [Pseudosulfitobacter sp. DSM 107133]UOA28808.1 hypothetical protein DSM107133_03566 [Pseudosulfitobacter sp. DSM 107133]